MASLSADIFKVIDRGRWDIEVDFNGGIMTGMGKWIRSVRLSTPGGKLYLLRVRQNSVTSLLVDETRFQEGYEFLRLSRKMTCTLLQAAIKQIPEFWVVGKPAK